VISRTQCASYCAAELRETARMPRKGKIMSRKEEITSGESIQNARIIPTTGCNDHFSNVFRPYVNLNGVKMNLLKVCAKEITELWLWLLLVVPAAYRPWF